MKQRRTLVTQALVSASFLLASALPAAAGWAVLGQASLPAGSPEAAAAGFFNLAHAGDVAGSRAVMTAGYEAWLNRLGGVAASLQKYQAADRGRPVRVRALRNRAGDRAIARLRFFSTTFEREITVHLNLVLRGSRWEIAL